ncbi:MAG: ABC transporter substrate-binding protein [Thermodesulfobacteriota bacterium]|nr:ABC transporter substrate-binding protein [Thermodesulfobacteriota bacterium]
MKKVIKNVLIIFLVTIFIGGPINKNSWASVPTERVKYTISRLIEILEDENLKTTEKETEKRDRLKNLAQEFFDFEEMAKRTLAMHWYKLSAEEKKDFTELFFELLEYTYIEKIKNYKGEEVNIIKERIENNFALVNCESYTKKGQKIVFNCSLINKNGIWNAYDISVEGISLVNNYRTQFNSIIRSSSYSELVEKIKDKLKLLKKQ